VQQLLLLLSLLLLLLSSCCCSAAAAVVGVSTPALTQIRSVFRLVSKQQREPAKPVHKMHLLSSC
jgi:hypothetical protein